MAKVNDADTKAPLSCRIAAATQLAEQRPRTMRGVLGESDNWVHLFRQLDRVVDVPCPVLLTGPPGAGKHSCARALHDAGARGGPFVFVDCLSEGHQAAAASAPSRGVHRVSVNLPPERWVPLARHGSLFVNELSALPSSSQIFLEEILRESSRHPRLRLICGSRYSTEMLLLDGAVRPDLFYRVSVVSCAVPPLRERGDDVLLLAQAFLDERVHDRQGPRQFSAAAQRLLQSYAWPGNISELRNVVEHATVVAKGQSILPDDLPSHLRRIGAAPTRAVLLPEGGIDLRQALERLENTLLQQALERTGWNKQRAARLLGLNRTTLVEMLKRKRLSRSNLTP